MYRQIVAVLIFMVVIAVASTGNATMEFSVDMNQDGTADTSWPLAIGDTVMVDIRVSNIPEPGLGAMGFLLTYDETLLTVTAANVDTTNWPSAGSPTANYATPGKVLVLGNRLLQVTGLSGNDIQLATVTFERISAGDPTPLVLVDRDYPDYPDNLEKHADFVLLDFQVLDTDIGAGVTLATIQPPVAGDVTGNGVVDLADAILTLQFLSETAAGVVHSTGDATGDGIIGVEEGIWILQKAADLR